MGTSSQMAAARWGDGARPTQETSCTVEEVAKLTLDAMVLGFSLMGNRRVSLWHGIGSSRHNRVLLATHELLDYPMADILQVFKV